MAIVKKAGSLLLAVLLAFSLWLPLAFAEEADTGTITVCVSVEKFTLNQGYKVEPVLVQVPEGTPASTVITDAFKANGIDNKVTTSSEWGNYYLSQIADSDTAVGAIPDFPDYIDKAIEADKDTDLIVQDDAWLGEFDFTKWSGWMYSVNNDFPNVGASSYTLKDGDVMRWQFTVYGYGSDLGADNREWGSTPIVHTADKGKLTFRVAQINGMADKEPILAQGNNQASYDAAIAVLKDMESTQAQVDTALAALNQLEAKLPGDANGDGVVNVTDLSIVKKNFGQEVTPGQLGDVDDNGIVNVTDLSIVKKNFGKR